MALHQLTLESLKDLDGGKAAIVFQNHLKRAAVDCEDRPGDATARKVTLELEFVPQLDEDGTCSEVRVKVKASSSLPKHRTRPYSMSLRRGGALVFNEDSLDDVSQATLFDGDDETEGSDEP